MAEVTAVSNELQMYCLPLLLSHISATILSRECGNCGHTALILTAILHIATTDEQRSRQHEKEKKNIIRCTEIQFADTHKCKHFYSLGPNPSPPKSLFLTAFLRGRGNQALYLVRRC